MPNTKTVNNKASDDTKNNKKSAPRHSASKQNGHYLSAFIGVVLVLAVIFVGIVVYANSYTKIYPNTYILDKNVSNMSNAELSKYISETFSADRLKGQTMHLYCEEQEYQLNIDDLKVSFDNSAFEKSVHSSGKDGNFLANTFTFIGRYFSPTAVEPIITYNNQVLVSAFDKVTIGLESDPVGHTFSIGDNIVTIHGPVEGRKANREKATYDAEGQIKSMQISNVIIPLKSIKPDPLDFNSFYKWLTSDSQNAYYEKVNGIVKVHPSKAKVEVDSNIVKEALNELETSDTNTVEVKAIITQPEKTSQHLSDALYSHQLSTYSTSYAGSSVARANNVQLAASRINGTELISGEEFSYDKTILPRTAKNGYMAAPVYVGNKVESGMGGGICQPSSTLYVAALYANLDILERHNHSLAVGYLPPGLDATIAEGVMDLRFKNNFEYPVKINASAIGGTITFTILGYNPNNTKVELIRSAGDGKYYVTRVVYKNGTEVKHEAMTSSVYGILEKDEEKKPKPHENKPAQKPEEKPQQQVAQQAQPQPQTQPQPRAPSQTQAPAQQPTQPLQESQSLEQ